MYLAFGNVLNKESYSFALKMPDNVTTSENVEIVSILIWLNLAAFQTPQWLFIKTQMVLILLQPSVLFVIVILI